MLVLIKWLSVSRKEAEEPARRESAAESGATKWRTLLSGVVADLGHLEDYMNQPKLVTPQIPVLELLSVMRTTPPRPSFSIRRIW